MKKRTIAKKVEKHWTVLLVDGQGRIRRLPHFRRKMWIVAGLSTGALLLAVVMGILYGGTLQKHRSLSEEVARLEDKLLALRQQNDLLKARAVRLETLVAKPDTAAKPSSGPATPTQKASPPSAKPPSQAPAKAPDPKPAPAPKAAPPEPAEPTAAEKPSKTKTPQVDAEGLKVAYRSDSETIEARFVIKNTGEVPAGGRAVVVLEAKAGSSPAHLAIPTVPLRNGRPVGNRGRRFSISRFMNVELERKFAEPGIQFTGAVVYAYTLEGRSLLEKPFVVALEIPAREPETPPPAPAAPTAAPLGLTLPEPEPEETTGVQP
jgi:outer membrane biosynthesis protein TonB